jgi:hypothetical protein
VSGTDTNQDGPTPQSPGSSSGSPWGKFTLSSQMLVALVALMISVPVVGSLALSGSGEDGGSSDGGAPDPSATVEPTPSPHARPELNVRGRWSGTVVEVGGAREERVRLRIASFDGERDGRLLTSLDGVRCDMELAWRRETPRGQRFEAVDLFGRCAPSIVTVARRGAETLHYVETWVERGRRMRFAGDLQRA